MAKPRKWFFPAGMIEESEADEFRWWTIGANGSGEYLLNSGPLLIHDGIGYLMEDGFEPIQSKRDSGSYWYRSLPRFDRCHVFTRERQLSCTDGDTTWFCQHGHWRPSLEELVNICPDAASEFQHNGILDYNPLPMVYDVAQERESLESILEEAISIAVLTHKGQTDKAGQPYILHPIRVMMRLNTLEERIVAILHDVIEDGPEGVGSDVRALLPPRLLAALLAVTKREREYGAEGYTRFIERAIRDPLARRVKIADLEDNLDVTRLDSVTAKDMERVNRYLESLKRLKDVEKGYQGEGSEVCP